MTALPVAWELEIYSQGSTTCLVSTKELPDVVQKGSKIVINDVEYTVAGPGAPAPKVSMYRNALMYLIQRSGFIIQDITGDVANGIVIAIDADTKTTPLLNGPMDFNYTIYFATTIFPPAAYVAPPPSELIQAVIPTVTKVYNAPPPPPPPPVPVGQQTTPSVPVVTTNNITTPSSSFTFVYVITFLLIVIIAILCGVLYKKGLLSG